MPSIDKRRAKNPFLKNLVITGSVVQQRPWYASVLAFLLALINALKGFFNTIFFPDAAADYKKKGSGSGSSGGLGLGGGGGGGGGSGGGGGGPGSRPRVGGMSSLRSVNPSAGGCCGGGCG